VRREGRGRPRRRRARLVRVRARVRVRVRVRARVRVRVRVIGLARAPQRSMPSSRWGAARGRFGRWAAARR